MEKQATIKALAEWLKAHDDFVLIGHVYPDGDAAGSCMGAMLALRALGKRAFVCLPNKLPRMFAKYPFADEIVTPDQPLPFEPKTAFSLDASEYPRMGDACAIYDRCEAHAMLDHHGTNPGFGEIFHIEGERIATGELVTELIGELGVEMTQDMATWLFIAISTDSGHFRFGGTAPSTMYATAKLLEAGVDLGTVSRELWNTRSKARTHLMGVVLANLEVSADGRMAWARLTNEMLDRCGALREDNEGIVNYLVEIEGVEFAALAEERENGTKFSLRSKLWLDVAEDVARPLGGGGHSRAAGCSLNLPMEEALARVLESARRALDNTETNGMNV